MRLTKVLIKPSTFCNPEQFNPLYNFNNLKLKTIFSVLVPRSLKMWAMMSFATKHLPVVTKPLSCVGSATNVELVVYNIADLVDDWLFHGCSVTGVKSRNVTPNTRCVSTGK